LFNSPRYAAIQVALFVIGGAILYWVDRSGEEVPRLATLLLLFLAREAKPGAGEKLLYASAFIGPATYFAMIGQSERIVNVVITCVVATLVFQLGWWHKGRPYSLGLAEAVLFLGGGIAVAFLAMAIVTNYRVHEPWTTRAVGALVVLFFVSAYFFRRLLAKHLGSQTPAKIV